MSCGFEQNGATLPSAKAWRCEDPELRDWNGSLEGEAEVALREWNGTRVNKSAPGGLRRVSF